MASIQSCFNNLIALRGVCDDQIPKSGLFINDLGISLNELNEFVSEDFVDGEDLFNTQYKIAVNIVTQTIHTYFQERYKAFSLIENKRVGYYDENNTLYAGGNELTGIMYELSNTDSYLTFYLHSISSFCNFTGNIPLFVYEMNNGTLLDTINIQSVSNSIVTTYANKEYYIDAQKVNLFIGYNTSGISFKGTSLTQSAGCTSCSKKPIYNNQFLSAQGGTLPLTGDKTRNNFDGVGNTAGLSITHSLNCNHQGWLCNISNLIALPVLYKTASLIVEYGSLITPNEVLTNRSTMNRDLLKERQSLYEQKYTEAINNILQNIELPQDERCFRCRQKSRTAVMLP